MRFTFALILILSLTLAACAPGQLPDATPTAPIPATAIVNIPTGTSAPTLAPDAVTDQQWLLELATAVENRDFAALRARMNETFTLANWRGEGSQMSANEALSLLQTLQLPAGSLPVVHFDVDPATVLGGSDPLAVLGPDSHALSAFYMDGLGPDRRDGAVLIVARDPATRQRSWRGMLNIPNGTIVEPTSPSLGDLDQTAQALAAALETRDFTALNSLMGADFAFVNWNTTLFSYPSAEALGRIKQLWLADGSAPAVIRDTDVPALLGGADPLSAWGPVLQPVRALHVTGLGPHANQEAVVVIGRDNAGQFYWLGLLYPPDGNFHPPAATPGS